MIKNNINKIKKLRKITGSGLIDCKNALIKSNNNIKNAIIEMRKIGILKFNEKKNISIINGIVKTKKEGKYGIIIEVNCQTDFTSKSKEFRNFINNIIQKILNNNIKNTIKYNLIYKNEIINLFNKIKENINIKRVFILNENIIEEYNHNNRIGVLIQAKFIQKKKLKKIAMHIASNKPDFINIENIYYNLIINEYKIQKNLIKKKNFLYKKILFGKIIKYINEITLINQKFIFNTLIKIKKILNNKNSIILNFIRYELGEKKIK
ncbi:MAG: translation elongation factor Ts [Enterobacteriaceae bacterium PC38]|nr:MAG: translation elongation factor Ts [Enterobacteriaceae bacterium PC38]